MPHEISIRDLEFKKTPVTCYSSRGCPYTRWINTGMPRIPEGMLDSVFFLYKNREDAEKGSDFGGSGFFIAMPSESLDEITYIYGVTNWHVAVRDGFSVIRINTVDGLTDILEFAPEDWEFDPKGGDLAIIPMKLDFDIHLAKPIPIELIVSNADLISKHDIGVGDDVFMLGRFVNIDSSKMNQPTARFGYISAMPCTVKQPTGRATNSYFLDMHSRTGYSGSPVFVYRTPGTNLKYILENSSCKYPINYDVSSKLILLGVHFGQFQELLPIKDDEGMSAIGMSGMTLAVPSWEILELLNSYSLINQRKDNDLKWKAKLTGGYFLKQAVAESALGDDSYSDAHREDFNNLLDDAVKGKQ